MQKSAESNSLVIERILRDRDGLWQQIAEERDLRGLTARMLTTAVISFALFGLVLGASHSVWQALSSMVKLPVLFLATLAICLPTLYLFNLVFGARLSMAQAVTLILVPITVIAALTLAFAPISLFFLITAQSYAFFKLLNVGILVLTAVVGLRFLTTGMAALNAQHAVQHAASAALTAPEVDAPVEPARELAVDSAREPALVGAADLEGGGNGGVSRVDGEGSRTAPTPSTPAVIPNGVTRQLPAPAYPVGQRPTSMKLVYVWILLFGFVGTQLAWTLRPFFGDPETPFALFREISGTFYSDILYTLGRLFS